MMRYIKNTFNKKLENKNCTVSDPLFLSRTIIVSYLLLAIYIFSEIVLVTYLFKDLIL